MSFAFIVMTMLFGSSVVTPFVLHPSKEELVASANPPISHHRCQDESLQSIRKSLLRALNMQTEPQLPAGGLDRVREQWQRTFSTISQSAPHTRPASDCSVPPDGGNSTSLRCCSVASDISMKDLGWDSWVIHPLSLTVVQCALCDPAEDTVPCSPSASGVQDANSQDQVPCCRPTSQESVPVVYMDETSTVVLSDVQLTRSCGCGRGDKE
ncbi:bone morphogenetic protein 6-like [Odontesthes bonariensis]|uniref:bone morphogenetic protein 6-like n=1 Tax=Odontesthes bonariensis TaxID=219752 RepID=UPI003F588E3A